MKRISAVVVIALLAFSINTAALKAQQKTEPEHKLVQFYMALFKKGPGWTAEQASDTNALHQKHIAYIRSYLESGKAMIAGPLTNAEDLRGVVIYRAASLDEAKAWATGDPAVSANHLVVEMHPWWSEDVLKKGPPTTKMETAYLGFLTRGAKWTPERTPATEELQKAHLANIMRLAELKKLVVAGPFGDNTNLRGIFVFRVPTLKEAQELAATDPAVQAGRLAIDIYPWQVPEGLLP
jgi:uncharacterized protein YciI